VGGAPSSDALVRQLGVTPADADAIKMGKSVGRSATVEPVLGSVTEFIVEEIQRAPSFFWTAATDEPLGGVILSGGPAHARPRDAADAAARCAVEVADPFRRPHLERGVDRQLSRRAVRRSR
jgi:Tfp pilus assembly PilM family ATPase